ncbi:hypothetical protein [Microvirga puerhi]|uniref:Uncharacterized protein n=1 Tax=Microvirga puerhi TaxID=2876078 RepID=A0ABS7VUW6_9HYPH|nr:hypothetical protein [Microvirga puerhi]MBZ6078931.1 hypothetical protein [Microvirga puerhi]
MSNRAMHRLRSVILAAGLVWGGQAHAEFCLIAVDDNLWLTRFDQANQLLNQRVDQAGYVITEQNRLNIEKIISAVKVLTKNGDVNSERQVTVTRKAQEASASVYVEQNQREAILTAQERFGPRGQSVDPCGSADLIGASLDSIENISKGAADLLKLDSVDVGPGKAQDVDQVIKARISSYSPAQVDVESLLSGSDEDAGRFLSHAAGLPLRKSLATDRPLEARLRLLEARRAEALRSPALMSLAAVRAAYHGASHGGSAGSAVEAIDKLLEVYGGGPKFEAWQKELATKHERGLLQEFTKLRALSLRLQRIDTEIDDRVSAVMAVLLAGETSQRTEEATDEQH